jgi:hypothetical protein
MQKCWRVFFARRAFNTACEQADLTRDAKSWGEEAEEAAELMRLSKHSISSKAAWYEVDTMKHRSAGMPDEDER